jgi:Na+/proline symporter
LTFRTPSHAAGPVSVTVSTPSGRSGPLRFTYVAALVATGSSTGALVTGPGIAATGPPTGALVALAALLLIAGGGMLLFSRPARRVSARHRR